MRNEPKRAKPPVTTGVDSATALPVLHEVLSALARGEARDSVLSLLTEKACLLTNCASAVIALREMDAEDAVSFVATAGLEAVDLLGSRVRATDTIVGNTARSGEPHLVFRPQSPSSDAPVESAIVVPIFENGVPCGALAALNKADHQPFDGSDFLLLSTLAAAASVVVSTTRLRESERRHQRELTLVYEAVRRVSGQLSLSEVLRAVVEQAHDHLENSAIVVLLANDERTHLYVAEDAGLDAMDREVTLSAENGLGAILFSATQHRFLTFNDPDRDFSATPVVRENTIVTEPIFPEVGARAALAAPIRTGDTAYGIVLVLSGQPPGVHTDADAAFLSVLASQAAVALENAWLYEDATRRAEEATTLYELSQAVTASLQLPEVLERVADSVLSLLGVDKFALFLLDRTEDRLRLVVDRHLAPGATERLHPRIGEGIPGWVMEFETPTAVQDVAADHRNASAPLHPEGVVSLIAMPLQVGVSTIGVLTALSTRRRLFTVGEMELLYTIANQAAVAIENARMYAQVRHRTLELRKYFHRVARALASSTGTPQNLPEMIAALTQEVMEADRCALHSIRNREGTLWCETAASVGYRTERDADLIPTPASLGTLTGWVATYARPLTVEALEDDARFAVTFERPVRGRATSYLGVPLRIGSDVVGVLEVYTRQTRHWRGDEVRLLLAFASQAAVAFQNARLAREREQTDRVARLMQRLLLMATATKPVSADEVVAAFALGLNAPIVTLYRSSERENWEAGPASIPPDTIPLQRLAELATAGGGDVADCRVAVATEGGAAICVLAGHDGSSQDLTRNLLETAATLLARELK